MRVAKTKALISCAVTAQLIFALFSHRQKSVFLMMWLKFYVTVYAKDLQKDTMCGVNVKLSALLW